MASLVGSKIQIGTSEQVRLCEVSNLKITARKNQVADLSKVPATYLGRYDTPHFHPMSKLHKHREDIYETTRLLSNKNFAEPYYLSKQLQVSGPWEKEGLG